MSVVGWLVARITPSDFQSGLFVGGLAVATILLTDRLAAESDGSWTFAQGRDAEVWTADDLMWFRRRRWLRRERWHVVHSVGFHRGDVDHVLVGPGGVFALETKYRSVGVRRDEDRALRDAADQVASGARRVAALIKQHTGEDVDVRPAVVTQGRGWTWPDEVAQRTIAGVPILRGTRSRDWELDAGEATVRIPARQITRALDDYAKQQLQLSRRAGGDDRGTRA